MIKNLDSFRWNFKVRSLPWGIYEAFHIALMKSSNGSNMLASQNVGKPE